MFKKTKFISMLLIVAIMFSTFTPTVLALTGTYNFTSNENSNKQLEDEFIYRDDCFERSSYLGCSHLETLSSQVAIASASWYGEEIDKNEIDYSENAHNLVTMLKDMEFENVTTNKYYTLEKQENSAGVTVGSKKINADGKDYTLLAIMPRSAGYKQEWVGNFTVGDGGIHEGFKSARDEVLRYVNKYIKDNNIQGNLKVWIAGHSRGAALANMLGGFFAGGGIEYFGDQVSITPEDVYCYTYATPRTIKNGADKNIELSVAGNRTEAEYVNDTPGESFNYTKGGSLNVQDEVYKGIRNFTSSSDIFPMLPPKDWGFTYYGTEIASDHGKVTKEAMLEELNKISPYAYNKYLTEGDPDSFERKTFDLKTLNIVKDNGTYSAMNIQTLLKERMAGLIHNASTNKEYKDEDYEETLKAVAGIYGMSYSVVDDDFFDNLSGLTSPLLYSYLAYASERLQEEGKAQNETEAVTIALEELLEYFTKDEINSETFTVDDFVVVFTKYIAENENEPITDKIVSGIVNFIPEDYRGILGGLKDFDKNNTAENEVTLEEGLKAFLIACYKGADPEANVDAYYQEPDKTRGVLYMLLSLALASDYPEIPTILMDSDYNMTGGGQFKDLVGIILNMLKTVKDDSGTVIKTYSTLSELADDSLKDAIDTMFEEPLAKSQNLYGSEYKNQYLGHIENAKANISKVRELLLYALLYDDNGFSAEDDVKNVTTFLGNVSILPLAHYNEVYVAYAKAAENVDCGYEDHTKVTNIDTEEGKTDSSTGNQGNTKNNEKAEKNGIGKNLPRTGDNITMWIVLMVISAIGSLVCAKHIKKKFMGK